MHIRYIPLFLLTKYCSNIQTKSSHICRYEFKYLTSAFLYLIGYHEDDGGVEDTVSDAICKDEEVVVVGTSTALECIVFLLTGAAGSSTSMWCRILAI